MSEQISIVFRCDGSPEIGFGHVARCLALADELRDVHGCPITFAMRKSPMGVKMVQEQGYRTVEPLVDRSAFDYGQWLQSVVQDADARILVLDVADDLDRKILEEIRGNGLLLAVLDDGSERRLAADLAFFPPVPQMQSMEWGGFTGQVFAGWEWVVLRREFAHVRPYSPGTGNTLLITMGGSDPAGLTLKALGALDAIESDLQAIIVLGPGFDHEKAFLEMTVRTRHRLEVVRSVRHMESVMARASLAVASFGVTAYELAATGTPAIYLCLTQDHARSASAFEEAGMGISLGDYRHVSNQALAVSIEHLLGDLSTRLKMAKQGRKNLDGRGAERIARRLTETATRGIEGTPSPH